MTKISEKFIRSSTFTPSSSIFLSDDGENGTSELQIEMLPSTNTMGNDNRGLTLISGVRALCNANHHRVVTDILPRRELKNESSIISISVNVSVCTFHLKLNIASSSVSFASSCSCIRKHIINDSANNIRQPLNITHSHLQSSCFHHVPQP
jgi:hypothetical protein